MRSKPQAQSWLRCLTARSNWLASCRCRFITAKSLFPRKSRSDRVLRTFRARSAPDLQPRAPGSSRRKVRSTLLLYSGECRRSRCISRCGAALAVGETTVRPQRSRNPQALVSERLQYGVVKTLASVDVPYSDRNVSNHGLLPECYAA